MMSQAVQFKQNQDQFKMKSLTDMSDMMYKSALTKQALANAEATAQPATLDQPSGIRYNGDILTWKQLEKIPANDRSYLIYKQSMINQNKSVMDQTDWEEMKPTERTKFIKQALKDPKIMNAAKDLAKSGATTLSIGEILKRDRLKDIGKAERSGEIDYLSGDYTKRLEKYMNTDVVKNQLLFGDDSEFTMPQRKIEEEVHWIESDIKAKGGQIIGIPRISEDGKSIVWDVKWPGSDTTREIKHGITGYK